MSGVESGFVHPPVSHLCDDSVAIVVLHEILDSTWLRCVQVITADEVLSNIVLSGIGTGSSDLVRSAVCAYRHISAIGFDGHDCGWRDRGSRRWLLCKGDDEEN